MRELRTGFMLIRHAEKTPGVEDLGLTEAGVAQATETARTLLAWRPSRLYTSVYPRAVQTAAIISRICSIPPAAERECLVERRVEPPPGLGTAGFKAEWAKVDECRTYHAFGGESSRLAGRRLQLCLRQIAYECPGARIVVVTHGGITRDFLLNLSDDEPAYKAMLKEPFLGSSIPFAGVTALDYCGGKFGLKFVAMAGPLLSEELRANVW